MSLLASIVVGDADCTIADVITVIEGCPHFTIFSGNYIELLKKLDVKECPRNADKYPLTELIIPRQTPQDGLDLILYQWCEKYKRKATLGKFVEAIKSMGFPEMAIKLENKFSAIRAISQLKVAENQPFHSASVLNEVEQNDPENSQLLSQNNPSYEMSTSKEVRQRRPFASSTNYNFKTSSFDPEHISVPTRSCQPETAFKWDGPVAKGSNSVKQLDILNNLQTNFFQFWKSTYPDSSEIYTFSADSYNDFQKQMHHAPAGVRVEARLQYFTDGDDVWPRDLPLQTANQITKLSLNGRFDQESILNILQQTTNLEHLEFIDSVNGIGAVGNNSDQIKTKTVVTSSMVALNNLQIIQFKTFSQCTSLFEMLSTEVVMKNLSAVYVIDSLINNHNIPALESFLLSKQTTLQSIRFQNTKWGKVSLFEKSSNILPYVREIEMDSLHASETEEHSEFIAANFCTVFQNLKTFVSGKGYLNWPALPRLLECSKLTHLKIGVNVSENEKFAQLSVLRNAYPYLKFVDIALHFSNKGSLDECWMEKVQTEPGRFTELKVSANCKLREL